MKEEILNHLDGFIKSMKLDNNIQGIGFATSIKTFVEKLSDNKKYISAHDNIRIIESLCYYYHEDETDDITTLDLIKKVCDI